MLERELSYYIEPPERIGLWMGTAEAGGGQIFKLNGYRRNMAQKSFPKLKGIDDAEINSVMTGIPDLVLQGAYRFDYRTNLPKHLRIFTAWWAGKPQHEIAKDEGFAKAEQVSTKVSTLLRNVRKKFDWEEISTGSLIRTPETEAAQKARENIERRGRWLLSLAYPDGDLDRLGKEELEMIFNELEKAEPFLGSSVNRSFKGETHKEIGDDLNVSGQAIYLRKARLLRRLGKTVPFDRLIEAVESESPAEELSILCGGVAQAIASYRKRYRGAAYINTGQRV